jgi:Holliday junction resolvasome RuvABC ATP-dependent DNA helicase subunit
MFNQTVVHKILTSNVVDVPDSYTRRLKPVYLDSPLIILSAREPRSLTYELRKSLDVHIELHPLNQSHIIKILKLKCQFYGFKASQSAIELIASNAMGNPNRAVRILLLGRDIMESEEKNKISAETARKAIVLTV